VTPQLKLGRNRQTGETTWQKAQEFPQGTEERVRAERLAQSAFNNFNSSVASFGELYGERFETGQGAGGWGYVKRRRTQSTPKGQPTAQRKATVGADFINHVAQSLNITPEEARRRIEADGYTVR